MNRTQPARPNEVRPAREPNVPVPAARSRGTAAGPPAVSLPWRPGELVGAVGVDSGRELGVEQQRAGPAEGGEVRQRAPADDDVAAAGGLRVALGRGDQALW